MMGAAFSSTHSARLYRLYAVFVDINRIPIFELNRINRTERILFVVRSNASIFGDYAHYPCSLTRLKFTMSIGTDTNDIVIKNLFTVLLWRT